MSLNHILTVTDNTEHLSKARHFECKESVHFALSHIHQNIVFTFGDASRRHKRRNRLMDRKIDHCVTVVQDRLKNNV